MVVLTAGGVIGNQAKRMLGDERDEYQHVARRS